MPRKDILGLFYFSSSPGHCVGNRGSVFGLVVGTSEEFPIARWRSDGELEEIGLITCFLIHMIASGLMPHTLLVVVGDMAFPPPPSVSCTVRCEVRDFSVNYII